MLLPVIPAIHLAYRIAMAEYPVRTYGDLESYNRAVRLDPANGEYWWMRGRFRHFDPASIDLKDAIADYEHALELNPRLGTAWLDLADAYERNGQGKKAEAAIQNALCVHTYSPSARWQAGNFYLLRGNLLKMYECFKMAGEYDPEKLRSALQLVWKVDPDRSRIETQLIPQNLPSCLIYLNFLVERDELDLAKGAWERCIQMPIPERFQYTASHVFPLIDHMLSGNRVKEAFQVWQQALQKGKERLIDNRAIYDPRESSGLPGRDVINLVWNGSYEKEMLNGGFDWRYYEIPEVELQTDQSAHHDGSKSLRLDFAPNNIGYSHLYQIVPIPASGMYRLEYYAKTEALTSDQRPYFAIYAYPENAPPLLQTEMLPASSSWEKYTAEFNIKPGTDAVLLKLLRDVSTKLGNQIQGSLWLDQISIRAQMQGMVSTEDTRKP